MFYILSIYVYINLKSILSMSVNIKCVFLMGMLLCPLSKDFKKYLATLLLRILITNKRLVGYSEKTCSIIFFARSTVEHLVNRMF